MKPISPTMHGVLDYAIVGLFVALPRVLHWPDRPRTLLAGATAGSTAYSLLTRYRLGAIRLLPMPVHLALDGLLNAILLTAAARLSDEKPSIRVMLVALALSGITVGLLTRTTESPVRQRAS